MAAWKRKRFVFWMDEKKLDEREIAKTIEILKSNRAFMGVLRDGIRLVVDLRAGQVNVLIELFPWIRDAMQPQPTLPSDIFERMVQMQQALDELNARAAQQPVATQQPTSPRSHESAPTSTGGVAVVTAVTAASGKKPDITGNFMKSLGGLASGFFD